MRTHRAAFLATIRCWPARWMRAAVSTRYARVAKPTCGRLSRSPNCSTPPAPTTSTPTKEYAALINNQAGSLKTLRGLFTFKFDQRTAVPLEEVEPAKDIVKRFATGAMSLGSISTEAHATLAIAMNRIGGKSNTGEGGEDAKRYIPLAKGETLQSRLATHRVEVDVPVRMVTICARRSSRWPRPFWCHRRIPCQRRPDPDQDGAGRKTRRRWPAARSTRSARSQLRLGAGCWLISPPPHHDIYSIEDLAQLIHDLKNANPKASISVKLVSEIGVGTVAAGVTKCKADHVVIAGHDGGTGASRYRRSNTPARRGSWVSPKHSRRWCSTSCVAASAMQADGQMKTGRDVVIGALLGADEFGFATAPLVVEGCIMMRKCHLNTCPVGVATARPGTAQRNSPVSRNTSSTISSSSPRKCVS